MTFLKKLGLIVAKGTAALMGLDPIIKQLLPDAGDKIVDVVEHDLVQIAAVIGTVEAVGVSLQLPGPQKLAAAGPLVGQVVLKSSLLAGKKIANPELFQRGCTKLGDGMADVLNSLHEDGAKEDDKT